jgi:hypothetical protein
MACGTPVAELSLALRVSTSPISPGQTTRVVVTAGTSDGKLGGGTVHLASDQGSLMDGVDLSLDTYGTATTDFVCDAPCPGPVQLTAKWLTITAKLNVPISQPVVQDPCVVGTVTSQATANDLSLFGTPVYFQNGAALAAGSYRLQNNGGCIKYGPGQNWTVHAYANGVVSWWIIGETSASQIIVPPGTVGFERVPGGADRDIGSFTDFALCDSTNRALAPTDFSFAGARWASG